jgi:histidine triad (HIT) family protein
MGLKEGATVSGYHDNIFTKIIDGEIPCHKVYEDEHILAFLDIGPLSEGHTLVIPKERKAGLHELSDESAAAIGRVLPRLCRAVMQATGAEAYNVLQNNGSAAHQAVPHVHFHIVPKFIDAGLQMTWEAGTLDNVDATRLANQMRASLGADGS